MGSSARSHPTSGPRAKAYGWYPAERRTRNIEGGINHGEEIGWEKVAILVTSGFEQVELTKPREALQEAGAKTHIVSLKGGKI